MRPVGLKMHLPPNLKAGSLVNLTCDVREGYGSFNLSWFVDSVTMDSLFLTTDNADRTKNMKSILELNLTSRDNGKSLTCVLDDGHYYKRQISRVLVVNCEYSLPWLCDCGAFCLRCLKCRISLHCLREKK